MKGGGGGGVNGSLCSPLVTFCALNITFYQRTLLGTSANQKRHYLKSYNNTNYSVQTIFTFDYFRYTIKLMMADFGQTGMLTLEYYFPILCLVLIQIWFNVIHRLINPCIHLLVSMNLNDGKNMRATLQNNKAPWTSLLTNEKAKSTFTRQYLHPNRL
jgi:hypothetical protein